MKICKKCNTKFDGRRCGACNSRIAIEWALKNKQKFSDIKKRHYRKAHPNPRITTDLSSLTKEEKDTHRKHIRIKSVYGISKKTWDEIMISQNHQCAICGYSVESETTFGLFADVAQGLMERNQARRDSIDDRVAKCAEIVNAS